MSCGHVLEACHDLVALAGDALLGLVDLPVQRVVQLGEPRRRRGAVGLAALALSRRASSRASASRFS